MSAGSAKSSATKRSTSKPSTRLVIAWPIAPADHGPAASIPPHCLESSTDFSDFVLLRVFFDPIPAGLDDRGHGRVCVHLHIQRECLDPEALASDFCRIAKACRGQSR